MLPPDRSVAWFAKREDTSGLEKFPCWRKSRSCLDFLPPLPMITASTATLGAGEVDSPSVKKPISMGAESVSDPGT